MPLLLLIISMSYYGNTLKKEVCPRNDNVQNVQKRSGCSKNIYMIYPFTGHEFFFLFICWIYVYLVQYVQENYN